LRTLLKAAFPHLNRDWLNGQLSSLRHPLLPKDPGGVDEWAIGIYSGSSLRRIGASDGRINPVLTRKHVSDVSARYVADPFMVQASNLWYLFFEVMEEDRQTGKGLIGLATSKTGADWTYERIVLDEPFHLSYPYVFEWAGEYYMTPESCHTNSVRLYRAAPFPYCWVYVTTLVKGHEFVDPSTVHFNNRWWLFTSLGTPPRRAERLHLFYANDLLGPWTEHPSSPVIDGDAHIARPGGRLLVRGNHVIRYAQDCVPIYGRQVRAFEITVLTPTAYKERRLTWKPILRPSGAGWNATGMHHIDAHPLPGGGWLACVDGWRRAASPL
jgi:hypothetical protein